MVALQCYTCPEPVSVSSCDTITTCNANETMCKTTLYSLETGQRGGLGRVPGPGPPPAQARLQPRPCVQRAATTFDISRESFWSQQPGSLPLSSPFFLEWEALAALLGSHRVASPLEAS